MNGRRVSDDVMYGGKVTLPSTARETFLGRISLVIIQKLLRFDKTLSEPKGFKAGKE